MKRFRYSIAALLAVTSLLAILISIRMRPSIEKHDPSDYYWYDAAAAKVSVETTGTLWCFDEPTRNVTGNAIRIFFRESRGWDPSNFGLIIQLPPELRERGKYRLQPVQRNGGSGSKYFMPPNRFSGYFVGAGVAAYIDSDSWDGKCELVVTRIASQSVDVQLTLDGFVVNNINGDQIPLKVDRLMKCVRQPLEETVTNAAEEKSDK